MFFFAGPWADPSRALAGDSARYILLADNLRKYHSFGKHEEDGLMHQAVARLREGNGTLPPPDSNGLRPESFRTPGYPLFLALCFALGGGIRTVLVFQCLLGALMACLVRSIALSLGLSQRGAVVAALVWALHPALILYDNQVLTESLFNSCAVGGLFLATRSGTIARLAGTGLLLGFAGLVRPLGLFYLPSALVLVTARPGRRLASAVCVVALAILPSGVWAYRNHLVGEGFRVSSVGDLNLLFYTTAYAISEERGEDWFRSWPVRVSELEERLREHLGSGEDVTSAARRLALSEIKARPGTVGRVLAKAEVKLFVDHSLGAAAESLGVPYTSSGLFSQWVLGDRSATRNVNPALVCIALVWTMCNTALAAGALVATLLALRRRSYRLLVGCVLTLVLFAVATNSVGLERFRMPMMFFILVMFGSLFGLGPDTRRDSVGEANPHAPEPPCSSC